MKEETLGKALHNWRINCEALEAQLAARDKAIGEAVEELAGISKCLWFWDERNKGGLPATLHTGDYESLARETDEIAAKLVAVRKEKK